MSTPKKPGTDLAALKARLAKKNQAKAAPPPAAEAPDAGAVPPPGQPLPPLGHPPAPAPEPAPPAPAQAYEPPAPGQAYEPPAPGQAYEPPPPGQAYGPPPQAAPAAPAYDPAPAPAAAPQAPMGGSGGAPGMGPGADDDPFGGGAGGFDPSDGVIDVGGDVPSKSNVGLMVFVFLGGTAFGGGVGWIGHNIVSKRELVSQGKNKGAEMVEAVSKVVDARKDVSIKLNELKEEKKLAADPEAAADEIEALLEESFDKQVDLDAMFGWELASVNRTGIRRTFQLYDEANRLKTDLGYLAAFLSTQSDALKNGGSGPSTFAVEFKKGGAKLVGLIGLMCPKAPAEGDAGKGQAELAPCTEENVNDAVALRVLDQVGAEPRVVPRGTEVGHAVVLGKNGAMYSYAVGAEPNKNAVMLRDSQVKRIEEHLEAMSKAEKAAQAALKNYAEAPTVDDSTSQPDPEGGGGE